MFPFSTIFITNIYIIKVYFRIFDIHKERRQPAICKLPSVNIIEREKYYFTITFLIVPSLMRMMLIPR